MEDERKIVAKLIDIETGEVLEDVYSGDRIIHQDLNVENQILNYNSNKKFVKLFDGTDELYKMINNDAAFTTCIRLSKCVCYDDCVLRTNGHHNGKILDIHDLSEILQIPYNTIRKHIRLLMNLGILAYSTTGNKANIIKGNKSTTTTIVVNPDVFMRGCNVNKTVKALFERAGWTGYKYKDITEK